MVTGLDLDHYRREGYVVLDVLSPGELARMRAAADAVMRQERYASALKFHYIMLIQPGNADATLLEAVDHPVLTGAAAALLEANGCGGGPLVLDNASMLAADAGASYKQGWHRDVLQVAEEFISDEMFSPRWRHNNVQLNLALADDAAFAAVPGSHQRPDTAAERRVFADTRHQSPIDAAMPGARTIALKAGQAALYNNNLIHRGTCEFTSPRRTLHIGYHSMRWPPTWHFYSLDDTKLPAGHLDSLSPSIRRWMEGRLARRKEYPDVKASYRSGLK